MVILACVKKFGRPPRRAFSRNHLTNSINNMLQSHPGTFMNANFWVGRVELIEIPLERSEIQEMSMTSESFS